MSTLVAPRARRVPIWRIRCATDEEVSPTIPSEVTTISRPITPESIFVTAVLTSYVSSLISRNVRTLTIRPGFKPSSRLSSSV